MQQIARLCRLIRKGAAAPLLAAPKRPMSHSKRPRSPRNRSDLKSVAVILCTAAALTLFAGTFRPAAAQSRQEKAKQLLDKALVALGGQSFLNVRTLKKTGRAYSFYRHNLRGLAVMTLFDAFSELREHDDPDYLPVSRREVYTEKGDYYTLFRNGHGWEVTYLGARPLPEDTLYSYRISARRDIFYILRYRLDEPDMYFYYTGTEIVDNTPTHAIDITDGNNDTVKVFLRMSDNLPVQQIYTRRDPKTRIPYEEKSIFSKYREVGWVTLPWNIQKQRDGDKIFEFFGRTAEVNGKIKADTFNIGKKVQILPPME